MEAIAELIVAKGEDIRLLKASKAAKSLIDPAIAELLSLKER